MTVRLQLDSGRVPALVELSRALSAHIDLLTYDREDNRCAECGGKVIDYDKLPVLVRELRAVLAELDELRAPAERTSTEEARDDLQARREQRRRAQ